jgi:RHS repeat-associated protein
MAPEKPTRRQSGRALRSHLDNLKLEDVCRGGEGADDLLFVGVLERLLPSRGAESPERPRCHALGVDYLNNRYYDPTVGVFLSVDPLVSKTGDPYLYASGNPTTRSDPSGLCAGNNGRQGGDDGKGPCGKPQPGFGGRFGAGLPPRILRVNRRPTGSRRVPWLTPSFQ